MIKRLLAIICFITIGIISATAQSKDITAVASAVENLRKAMIDADSASLVSLTADGLSYGHSAGLLETKSEFISKIVSGASNFETIDLTQQTISISGDAAIVRHQLDGTTLDNGKAAAVHLKVLQVWQKQKGKWKLLARQAIKVTT